MKAAHPERFQPEALGLFLALFALTLPFSISAAEISLLICALLFFWGLGRGGRPAWGPPGGSGAVWALYLAVLAAACAAGVSPLRSLHFLNKELHKPALFLFFAASLPLVSYPRAARWLFAGFLASALAGIYQAASWHGLLPALAHPFWLRAGPRAHGSIHPVTFGESMVFCLCGALALWLRPDPVLRWKRAVPAAALGLGSAALILSGTRGAWMAMAAALAVFALRAPRRLWPLLVLGAALAGGLLLPRSAFSPFLRERLQRFADPAYEPNAARLEYWKTAVAMAKDRPLLGVGPSNYWTEFPRYHPEPVEGHENAGNVHDIYLQHLAERGLLGLAALLLLFAWLWSRALADELARADAWSLWSLSAATAFLVMNLTESSWQVATTWHAFAFLWAGSRSLGAKEL